MTLDELKEQAAKVGEEVIIEGDRAFYQGSEYLIVEDDLWLIDPGQMVKEAAIKQVVTQIVSAVVSGPRPLAQRLKSRKFVIAGITALLFGACNYFGIEIDSGIIIGIASVLGSWILGESVIDAFKRIKNNNNDNSGGTSQTATFGQSKSG